MTAFEGKLSTILIILLTHLKQFTHRLLIDITEFGVLPELGKATDELDWT